MGTVDAYNRLAAVWADTTDDNLWNELLERRMVRSLLPADLTGARLLDAGCAVGTLAMPYATAASSEGAATPRRGRMMSSMRP